MHTDMITSERFIATSYYFICIKITNVFDSAKKKWKEVINININLPKNFKKQIFSKVDAFSHHTYKKTKTYINVYKFALNIQNFENNIKSFSLKV